MCPPIVTIQNLHPDHAIAKQSKSEQNNIPTLFPTASNKFNCSSEEITLDEKKGFLCMAEAGHSALAITQQSVYSEKLSVWAEGTGI